MPDATTFLRATLRHPDFCAGWNALITLGATDTEHAPNEDVHTYQAWLQALTDYKDTSLSLREHVGNQLHIKARDIVFKMLDWLGLFSESPLAADRSSHGEILLQLLQEKWVMQPEDKDMVVMQHEVGYTHRGRPTSLVSSMVIKGENRELSAMAKTVGLPMAILTRMVVNKKLKPPVGVLLPGMPQVYRPVLHELTHYGIEFQEIQN